MMMTRYLKRDKVCDLFDSHNNMNKFIYVPIFFGFEVNGILSLSLGYEYISTA